MKLHEALLFLFPSPVLSSIMRGSGLFSAAWHVLAVQLLIAALAVCSWNPEPELILMCHFNQIHGVLLIIVINIIIPCFSSRLLLSHNCLFSTLPRTQSGIELWLLFLAWNWWNIKMWILAELSGFWQVFNCRYQLNRSFTAASWTCCVQTDGGSWGL